MKHSQNSSFVLIWTKSRIPDFLTATLISAIHNLKSNVCKDDFHPTLSWEGQPYSELEGTPQHDMEPVWLRIGLEISSGLDIHLILLLCCYLKLFYDVNSSHLPNWNTSLCDNTMYSNALQWHTQLGNSTTAQT